MSLDVCLQDHFRSIVKPAYTNVYRERGGVLGVVEFDTREDLERAIRKLDDTEFKNPFDRAYIRVIDESDDRGGRSRSRSPRGRSGLCIVCCHHWYQWHSVHTRLAFAVNIPPYRLV